MCRGFAALGAPARLAHRDDAAAGSRAQRAARAASGDAAASLSARVMWRLTFFVRAHRIFHTLRGRSSCTRAVACKKIGRHCVQLSHVWHQPHAQVRPTRFSLFGTQFDFIEDENGAISGDVAINCGPIACRALFGLDGRTLESDVLAYMCHDREGRISHRACRRWRVDQAARLIEWAAGSAAVI